MDAAAREAAGARLAALTRETRVLYDEKAQLWAIIQADPAELEKARRQAANYNEHNLLVSIMFVPCILAFLGLICYYEWAHFKMIDFLGPFVLTPLVLLCINMLAFVGCAIAFRCTYNEWPFFRKCAHKPRVGIVA